MSTQKLKKICSHPSFEEMDAMMIVKPENVLYVLGFKVESDIAILLSSEEELTAFFPSLEYEQAKKHIEQDQELAKVTDIQLIPPGKPRYIQKFVKKQDIKALGFEDEFLSVKRYGEWKKKFKVETFIGASEILKNARLIKTTEEIERMKKASELGDKGFKKIHDIIDEGMTEKELAAEAEFEMRKSGSEGTSFDTIVASGKSSAYPHAYTSEKAIEDGDLIIVDIGAKYGGYCSDMTRSFIYGKQGEDEKKIITLVNAAQQHGLENARAGIECRELDKLVRDYIIAENKEWGKYFNHSLGHGVGIDIHEDPPLSPISSFTLKENMVVTIEPGLYIPELGGARTEDMVIIRKNDCEPLTRSKKYNY